ncbi:hypothetical protein REPUB_Repub07fG0107200 [Reevesia pubescens]
MKIMLNNADTFIALPGGFETLEEIFQIISYKMCFLFNKLAHLQRKLYRIFGRNETPYLRYIL